MKLIVAIEQNGGIGRLGHIPWNFKEDRKFFKFMTSGERVFMGRKTYESLPEPLSDRYNFVITSETSLRRGFHKGDRHLMYSINDGFIIGGQQLYEDAFRMSKVDEIYVSRINEFHECDTFFAIPNGFRCVSKLKLSDNCTVEKWII
jgi:dihydrofolate reductase